MTREEAKDLLDNPIGFVEDNHGADYDEALKLAIKALEQEPSEDCISRQVAIDTIRSMFAPTPTQKDMVEDCLEIIENLPSAQQEPCEDCISRQAVLKPYQTLKDSDTICIWLLRKNIEQIPSVIPKHKPCISRQTIKDIDRAFKALEERDELLDKIRAEIEKLNPVDYGSIYSYESHYGAGEMQNDVLDIIDKYKESEET
jgi:hypothetical protein